MSLELPIACSLDRADFTARIAEMSELGGAALVDARRVDAHAELRFAAKSGVRQRLDAIVAAELHCCAFLTMRVDDRDAELMLTIDAPEDADMVVQELVEAFEGTIAAS